jgi:tol-pal system protein YbgF
MLAVSAGCVNTDVIVQKQGEMERRLEAVAQSGMLHAQRSDDLAAQLDALQQSQRQTREELESLKGAVQSLRAELALQSHARVGDVSRIEVVNRDAVDRESAAPEEYVKAFGLFSASDYAGAIKGFEAFIRANPGSEYAGNARYWIGECYYARKEYNKARAAFQSLIDGYPASGKVPDAMLKLAYSLLAMNELTQGRRVLDELVSQYPGSQAAASAQERLNSINERTR